MCRWTGSINVYDPIFQIFEITVGEFSKCKFDGEIFNEKVIDWIWQNMPALGL